MCLIKIIYYCRHIEQYLNYSKNDFKNSFNQNSVFFCKSQYRLKDFFGQTNSLFGATGSYLFSIFSIICTIFSLVCHFLFSLYIFSLPISLLSLIQIFQHSVDDCIQLERDVHRKIELEY